MAMAVCGRCGKSCTPGADAYMCGSTGNPKNPNEMLFYHKICPERSPIGECSDGGHSKYLGTCYCEPENERICEHCKHCKICEQHVSPFKRGFMAVSKALTGQGDGDDLA